MITYYLGEPSSRWRGWPASVGSDRRRPRLREISWRASDDERQFVANAHRNHVAFDPFADSNAGIETLGDDVGERLVEGQVQRNFGILREKPRDSLGLGV